MTAAADAGFPVTIHDTPDALGTALAATILDGVAAAAAAGRRYLLGCPGGRSARPVYDALGRMAADRAADLGPLVIVMMDEYMVEGPDGPVLCDPDAHYSCRRFARDEIVAVLDRDLPPARRLAADALWLADPADPPGFDRRLAAAGGIDLFLLASGASDGHVAFNPPGSPSDGPTTILRLAEATRRDNLATFPEFRALAEVPPFGLTVGLGTIACLSRAAAMIIHGAHKRDVARRLRDSTGFDPAWPATILHLCRGPHLHLDRAAADRPES